MVQLILLSIFQQKPNNYLLFLYSHKKNPLQQLNIQAEDSAPRFSLRAHHLLSSSFGTCETVNNLKFPYK